MKRLLLPASALVLVLTACGAGAKPAPRVTEVGARLLPSVHAIAARRERAATREAKRFLHEFTPPPGAHPTRRPRSYGGVLRRAGGGPIGETVDVHRFWQAHMSLAAVATYVRTLRIPGAGRHGATYGSGAPHYLSWSFSGAAGARFLNVTAVALPHRTVIRVDALVAWIYPRSPTERVPEATRTIVVRAPKASATVTDPAKVAEIVHWFDALPISPPGVAVACPLMPGADITLSFRSGGGAWLAQAKVPRIAANVCDAIAFRIGGDARRPLVDRASRESFAGRLQDLLGIPLLRDHYR